MFHCKKYGPQLQATEAFKATWQELAGVPAPEAERVIKKDIPLVDTTAKMTAPVIRLVDCCNCVILVLDSLPNGKVTEVKSLSLDRSKMPVTKLCV